MIFFKEQTSTRRMLAFELSDDDDDDDDELDEQEVEGRVMSFSAISFFFSSISMSRTRTLSDSDEDVVDERDVAAALQDVADPAPASPVVDDFLAASSSLVAGNNPFTESRRGGGDILDEGAAATENDVAAGGTGSGSNEAVSEQELHDWLGGGGSWAPETPAGSSGQSWSSADLSLEAARSWCSQLVHSSQS